jgi:hypothetical protein
MVQIAARLHFDNMIVERIGPKSVPGDFPAEDLTPEYEHYRGHTIDETRTTLMRKVHPTMTALTRFQRWRRETTISLLRYCSLWAAS